MKILFSNPPWWDRSGNTLRKGIRAGSRWPFTMHAPHMPDAFKFGGYLPAPFFLQYAASYTAKLMPEAQVTLRDSIARGEGYAVYFDAVTAEQPDWIVIETATPSWDHDKRVIEVLKLRVPAARVIICGTLDTVKAEEILSSHANVHAVVKGEYDKQIATAIHGARGIYAHALLTLEEMNAAPAPMSDPVAMLHYWDACPVGHKAPQLQVWSSRGCPYKCLSGDTPVNTVHGMIPIKELAEKYDSVGVFTYDRATRKAKVCTATAIRQYGDADKLVRVHFDDGSHIDCTPDHRFLAFKWGNQFTGETEWECEAKDLKAGAHVRALKTTMDANGYIDCAWSRRARAKAHRMVAAWTLGRELKAGEQVHHRDHNKANNDPRNLEVCESAKEHFAKHPEIAERMRTNNPTRNGLSSEWRARMSAGNKGKVRTPEARERYRLAAIKREAQKAAARANDGRFEPFDLINHRVVRVEELPGLHASYCLTVPETHWFYANNVLVANCCFCSWPATMTGNDPDGTNVRSVRCYSPEYMTAYLAEAMKAASERGMPFQSLYDDSDTFNLNQVHTRKMCAVYKATGLPWSAMCRADTVDRETWQMMRDSGCFGVKIGFESGSQDVIDKIVNKRLNLAKAAETAIWLRSIGMSVHGTFTVGLPGETEAQQRQTLGFISHLYNCEGLDTHQLSGTATIEGTPLAAIAAGEHLEKYPGAHAEGFKVTGDGQMKIEEMRK